VIQQPFPVVLAAAVALSLAPANAHAQVEEDHSAHHPAANSASAMPMPTPSQTPTPSSDAMAEMMAQMMGEGEHHRRQVDPFYPRLIGLPALTDDGRHRLAGEVDMRIHQGLALLHRGVAGAERAATAEEARQAADQMREGLDLFHSGSTVRAALADGVPPQRVALNWFREEMGMAALPLHGHEGRRLFGASPAHLLFMTILVLMSAGLLMLQVARARRVRALVERPGAVVAGLSPREAADVRSRDAPPLRAANAPPAGARASQRPPPWTGQLKVAHIVRETPTIETYRLVEPLTGRLPFDFLPGQFLQVEVELEPGKTARRSYTIASSPSQRAYVELTVKREEHGAVSRYLHDHVEAGDFLKLTGPFGKFTFTGSDADSIVLIAGGVGITPMMSVLRYLTDIAWPGDIFFVYGARSPEEFVFRDEIERLERLHERLRVFATMQDAASAEWAGPTGMITKEALTAAVPNLAQRRIHLCGPPPMMDAVRGLLVELGVPHAQIHSEAFGPASLPIEDAPAAVTSTDAPPASPAQARGDVAAATITFALSGVSAALRADQTVLEAAEDAGIEIPYACRVGDCGVCVTRLLEGEVTMAIETGLDPADAADGYVLACQARSTGGPLVVEA
jgi:ferredoxin-NADP reductase